jgi:uncharacterized membrane protein
MAYVAVTDLRDRAMADRDASVAGMPPALALAMRKNITDWERLISVAAAAGLLAYAARRSGGRSSMMAAGVGLLARGVSGYCPITHAMGKNRRTGDTRDVLSGSGGIRLEDSVTVSRSPEEVYTFWRDLANLPQFLRHIERITELDGIRSHWVMRGPAGMKLEWDAEIINEVPGELIGWRSLPGAYGVSGGSVNFRPLAGGTQVDVGMPYEPPGG